MTEVTMQLPDRAALALKVQPDQLAAALRLAAAVKLYELGKLSSGAAAELAGLPKPLFLTKLHEYGVTTFDLSKDELQRELMLDGVDR
jgi:predicted HTH domain antitoxin